MTEVINDLLGYDGLKVIQRPDMFNFSLDSLLLGYFTEVNYKTNKIIDFCTGNAPVAMYLSLKTDKEIHAVEIQEDVYDLAKRSIEMNNLQDQIKLYNRDLVDIHKVLGINSFDLVTCNPPFFKLLETSNLNKNDYKTIARHEVSANIENILIEAKRLLKNKGVLSMVHRPERLVEILSLMKKHSLEPKTLRFVYPKKGAEANTVLIKAQKSANVGVKILEPIFVYENGEYSEVVREVFHYKKNVL
ncbi:tRNA1(Val) (adenine(37)-N6)-methyltransferase [Mycoplasmatota bacterium WC44]